jgi:hypothetical protein
MRATVISEAAHAAHLAGRERSDTEARREELPPGYQTLAANVSW